MFILLITILIIQLNLASVSLGPQPFWLKLLYYGLLSSVAFMLQNSIANQNCPVSAEQSGKYFWGVNISLKFR